MAEETQSTAQDNASGSTGTDTAAFTAAVKKEAAARRSSGKGRKAAKSSAQSAEQTQDGGSGQQQQEQQQEQQQAATDEQGSQQASVADDGGHDEWQPTKRQVDAAKQLGLTDDEIAELSEGQMKALEKASVNHSRKMSELGRMQQQVTNKAPGAKADSDAAAVGDDEPFEAEEFSEDYWGEESGAQHITSLGKHIEKLYGLVKELTDARHADEDQKVQTVIDGFFDKESIPTALHDRYGAGEARVGKDSDAGRARDELVAKAAEIQIGYRIAHDGEKLPLEDALDQAMRIIDSDALQGAAADRKADAIRKRSQQRISAGSGRQPGSDHSGLTKKEQAVFAITQEARKRGIAVP